MIEDKAQNSRLSRRNFLAAATAGTAGASLGVVSVTAAHASTFDEEVDVLVVGAGAGGLAAAVAAAHNGAKVLVVEKAETIGGTTMKSGGVYWVPNNHLMRADSREDPRDDALRYMARLAKPHLYDVKSPTLGLSVNDYNLLARFYDQGSRVVQDLEDIGALKSVRYPDYGFGLIPDYYAGLPENKAPQGRSLHPANAEGQPGYGYDLVTQMEAFLSAHGGEVRLDHAVVQAIADENRAVIGAVVRDFDGKEHRIRAKKGVVFATGGFTQNPEMRDSYLRTPVMGGCAVLTNQGDFVKIAIDLGAELGNMNEAWLQQEVLDEVLEYSSVPFGVFFLGGDSMIMVNKHGKRTCSEKTTYNDRTRSHLVWDPARAEYVNRFQFMIFDDNARAFGGVMILGPTDELAPYIIKADTLEDLAKQIDLKLASYEDRIGHFRLDENFMAGLNETITRFNGFAVAGKDLDFHRGETPIETYFPPLPTANVTTPNPFMAPISEKGPYYAIVLAAGTLDTKGGAVFDQDGRVLDTHGKAIDGLYVAGNASASPSGQSYWGAGGTIALALTFGYLAGEHAAAKALNL